MNEEIIKVSYDRIKFTYTKWEYSRNSMEISHMNRQADPYYSDDEVIEEITKDEAKAIVAVLTKFIEEL